METLFTIIFFVIALIFSSIMKKKQAAEAEDADSWPEPGPRRDDDAQGQGAGGDSGRMSWEEELRRLLQGEAGAGGSTPPTSAPPPILQPALPSQPAPAPTPEPRPARARLHEWKTDRPQRRQREERASLPSASRSYERARRLDETVTDQVREAARRLTLHGRSARGGSARREIRDALDLVRSPSSLRTAVIASIILGPPRAMQEPGER